jgi:cobalamin biosynthesis protein CbiG
MDEKQLEAVRRAKARFSSLVPKGVDVVGVGIGVSGSDPALKVNLRAAPKDRSLLPKTIEGVQVIYDYVGKITPR